VTERESVTPSGRGGFDWSVTLPSGRKLTGHADTADQAHRDAQADWRVRGDTPRHVTGRTPRGLIPPAPKGGDKP
jgi:hypothetical protein